jgi:hemolysin activation/secretion protein
MKPLVAAVAIAPLLLLGAPLACAQLQPTATPVRADTDLHAAAGTYSVSGPTLIAANGLRLILAQAQSSSTPETVPSHAPAPASTPAPARQPAPNPRFNINKFIVHGATLITADELRRILAPFTGKNKDFGDVQKALEALQNAYASRGYSAVQVILPEQQIEAGEIRFKVIEAKVGKVVVEGNRYFDAANIRASLPHVQPGQAPNVFQISDDLRLANENPAKQTTVLLRSGDKEGQVNAVARVVDDRPNKLSLTLDNTGTQQTGNFRVGFGYQNANMFNRDQVLNMQYVTAPNDADKSDRLSLYPSRKVLIFGAQYQIPLYTEGDSLEFSAGYSNVDSGVVANLFTISGSGSIFGVRYIHNLKKIGNLEHKLTYGAEWRAYRSIVRQIGVAGFGLVPDITVHPVSLTYSGVDRKRESASSFYVSVSRNLPGGNDGGTGEFQGDTSVRPVRPPARAGANPDYLIGRWGFNYDRQLPRDLQFRWGMSGQLTRDMLIPQEQFGIGGADSVRGFLEREIIDDNGYRGTLELYGPDFGGKLPIANARMRALMFYDWGAVRRVHPAVLEIAAEHIGSVGFGVRFSRSNNVSVRLDAAMVTDAGGVQGKGDMRLHMSLAYIY